MKIPVFILCIYIQAETCRAHVHQCWPVISSAFARHIMHGLPQCLPSGTRLSKSNLQAACLAVTIWSALHSVQQHDRNQAMASLTLRVSVSLALASLQALGCGVQRLNTHTTPPTRYRQQMASDTLQLHHLHLAHHLH